MTVVRCCLQNRVWLRIFAWSPDLDASIQSAAQQVALQQIGNMSNVSFIMNAAADMISSSWVLALL